MRIETVCTLAKGVSAKREKREDKVSGEKTEPVVCHLKFNEAMVAREVVEYIVNAPVATVLWNHEGMAIAPLALRWEGRHWFVSGAITGAGDQRIKFKDATLKNIELGLGTMCAELSAEIVWDSAGDELEDLAPLLGQTCRMAIVLHGGPQRDMFADVPTIDSVTITNSKGDVIANREYHA